MKQKIYDTVINTLKQFNEDYDKKIDLLKGNDIPLFKEGSELDSLELVNLIVEIESNLEDEIGTTVTLTSEKAMSRKNSPFLTVGTLTEYIQELITEEE